MTRETPTSRFWAASSRPSSRNRVGWQTFDSLDDCAARPSGESRQKGFRFYLTVRHTLYGGSSLPWLPARARTDYNKEAFRKVKIDGLSAPLFPALPWSRYVPDPNTSLAHRMAGIEYASGSTFATFPLRLRYNDDEDPWECSEEQRDSCSQLAFGPLDFPPFLISQRSGGESMVVVRMTHAQLDDGSFPLLSRELTLRRGRRHFDGEDVELPG
ncbi:hypothetical protein CDD83_6008 [Cordyceps sp. RAO-2017]|nr:hypothetical protein CDD83_6008 [Cordyceps sp. RAO-2017]